jgi:RNA polymerase sigma factor (sigma-70 family)
VEVSALKPSAVPALRGPIGLLRLQSDERLIALVRRGNHVAFEALVSRYQSRLLAFCRHMLGSREDAEDVLQEVFAAAFNAILADERPINVRPWLYRIARNRSLNHLRRASAIGVDSMDVHYAEHGISTAEKVLRRESFRQLIGDVHKLPETQRTALLLREIDALSYEQIADAMETTVPAVKSLLVRARISLAEAAEARKLSCEEARMELGEVAEGLVKMSAAVRRHTRECERCRAFRRHLKDNNVALAAMLPVGPLLLIKKLALTKLGSTAGAGGAHVAGAGGAGAAAGASAVGSASATGSLVTAGASALATKAAAGLAVAAIVTAGTVEAEQHSVSHSHRHRAAAIVLAPGTVQPVVTHSSAQPVTVAIAATAHPGTHSAGRPLAHSSQAHVQRPLQQPKTAVLKPADAASPASQSSANNNSSPAEATAKPVSSKPQAQPPATEVTNETTQLTTTTTSPPPQPTTAAATTQPEAASPPAGPPATASSTETTPSTPPPAAPPAAPPVSEASSPPAAAAAPATDHAQPIEPETSGPPSPATE